MILHGYDQFVIDVRAGVIAGFFVVVKIKPMNRIKKLEQRKDQLQDELYMLHFAEPSPEQYMQRRNEIEHEIVCIEESIDLEKKMAPFKWMLYGFIVVACAMLVWAFIEKNN